MQGKYIFEENDMSTRFYFILTGKVAVQRKDEFEKNKREVQVLGPGDKFGDHGVENARPRSADCVAKTNVEVAYWDVETYNSYIKPIKDVAKAQKAFLSDGKGKLLSNEELVEKASIFLDDAINERQPKLFQTGPWRQRVNKFVNQFWAVFLPFFLFLCVCVCVCVCCNCCGFVLVLFFKGAFFCFFVFLCFLCFFFVFVFVFVFLYFCAFFLGFCFCFCFFLFVVDVSENSIKNVAFWCYFVCVCLVYVCVVIYIVHCTKVLIFFVR